MKLHRVDNFRLHFNDYQHAYFSFLAKNYTFCLNLLTEWVYQLVKHLEGNALKQTLAVLDHQISRNRFDLLVKFGFPSKLYLAIYKRLPSGVSQNIWREAQALALARRNKPQKEFHFRIHYFGFTWTDINPKSQELKLPRSKYAKKFFKDPVKLTIPSKVYQHLTQETNKWYLRFRFINGFWQVDIVKTLTVNFTKPKTKLFAAIDINLMDLAFIDEVAKQPVLFSLRRTWSKSLDDFKAYSKYQSTGNFKLAAYRRRKIVKRFRQVFKLYAVRIVKWCKQHGITHIAIGNVKPSIPRDKNLPKWLRRLWNLVPWTYFYEFLQSYAEKHGIWVYHKNEAYTSVASALDNDPLPKNKDEAKQVKFSGKRVARSLYLASDGTTVHADINAAANLLRRAVYDMTGRIITFTKHQLSAVRRVGYQVLHYLPLDLALRFKRLKDYVATPGRYWSELQRVVTAVLQSGLKHGILTSLFRIP